MDEGIGGLYEVHNSVDKYYSTCAGKTYMAKAIAGEAMDATFLEIKMNDILSSFRGKSENNIVAMFDIAEILQPTIIFIGKLTCLRIVS